MKYRNIVAYSSIIAGLLGCEEKTPKETPEPPKYFATVPTYNKDSPLALTKGDFDKDGDLDLIVGTYECRVSGDCDSYLYLYLNDGKGNFTFKEPAKK